MRVSAAELPSSSLGEGSPRLLLGTAPACLFCMSRQHPVLLVTSHNSPLGGLPKRLAPLVPGCSSGLGLQRTEVPLDDI